ncbi:RmlC-like cupin domain-containing protein [Fusarium venenatum]|uniref:RmlC-like cupin domain-containing protein n=1 Tax=Fusarium venenatum TaxID=56646 RepID=UPI001E18370C|nr:RmlC-like cupin domain-containing protein [Fusarium venenatum]
MPIPIHTTPPPSRTSYIIQQLEGERLSIPGSKGTFRILASTKQTDGQMSVFQSGAVLSDAPGFHYHKEAHDVFLVTKGFMKLWNGDKCRIMGPGDFAYVPPNIIHNPELMGPHTETLGLVVPGDWIDFFRYIGEPFEGNIVPEHDNRDLKSHVIPKVMSAPKDFDVHFVRDYQPPAVGEWEETENVLPGDLKPYFLRANTGPRWVAGGVMSRPFITTKESGGKFAISSIESSGSYKSSVFSDYLAFPNVDHCLCILEGALRVVLKGDEEWVTLHEGETVMIAAGQSFKLEFGSRYVRFWSFTDGPGIEELIQQAGESYQSFVLPDEATALDQSKLDDVVQKLGAKRG